MNLTDANLDILRTAMQTLTAGFDGLPPSTAHLHTDQSADILSRAARRLHNNYPYHHPLYVGQMLKPPHPIAQLAYALAMNLNPNNHALDGGRESSQMEKEAVAAIAQMFGWTDFMGHLCGGGTMANFEALWVSRELNQSSGKMAVLASSQSHYTHSRLSQVLQMPYRSVEVDKIGNMDMAALERELEKGDVGLVVATLGSTLAGTVDPLPDILALRERYGFRLHVDTAYGGYFMLTANLDPAVRMAYDAIRDADSVVVDPHKHGLQPYGCGCVLFKDPSVGRIYQHDSPYTYFSSEELHLGEITLECSRAGASAVALWCTHEAFPLTPEGEFAASLTQCRQAAMTFYQWLHDSARFTPLFGPQLDIVCWAVDAPSASEASKRANQVFDQAAKHDLHLAVASVPKSMCSALQCIDDWDQDSVSVLRACVMKPEHLDYLDVITRRLDKATVEVLENDLPGT
ncbi:MAG: aminotransferase class V-fold PLP-dependent enzyme [Pseudomonadota bacterium]